MFFGFCFGTIVPFICGNQEKMPYKTEIPLKGHYWNFKVLFPKSTTSF